MLTFQHGWRLGQVSDFKDKFRVVAFEQVVQVAFAIELFDFAVDSIGLLREPRGLLKIILS